MRSASDKAISILHLAPVDDPQRLRCLSEVAEYCFDRILDVGNHPQPIGRLQLGIQLMRKAIEIANRDNRNEIIEAAKDHLSDLLTMMTESESSPAAA